MNGIRQRFARVLTEVERSLDEPLDIRGLAGVAAYSRFHFQRQFSAFFGVSITEYQRLMRMKRAGQQLAFRPSVTVTEIAYDAGYENLESFSRIFKRVFRQTPSEFRKAADWTAWHQTYDPLIELKGQFMPVGNPDFTSLRISEFPETLVAVFEHKGPQSDLPASVQKFIAWRKENALPPSKSATFNILYYDPKSTIPEDFRFDICCAVSGPVTDNEHGVVTKTIPGGPVAVVRHTGSLDFAERTIRALYRDWLPQSGRELRDFPLFVQRLSFFPDVPEHAAQTDIFLPLQ
ncbi:MAG: AraC family transcriptional regulator [Roseibium sp.]|uniref:AraC family transcriptional regulator n=1 Tax=Roseibium sp. TaxID=1936156 RepID=UPI00262F2CBA|nr:AraC family transcriptional regulator [Roseibium sp.]MCV0424442.1 AraC family transcriptional regulator [Roseibium sp.]